MTVTIEWMDTQEALPGEAPSTRWYVPEGVRLHHMPTGLVLERPGQHRFHPWHRVRWIDAPEDAPPEPKRDTEPAPAAEPERVAVVTGIMTEGGGESTRETLTDPDGASTFHPVESDVLAKLGERQGRRRKR